MPLYDYRAKTTNGDLIDERIEASSKAEAIAELQNQRMLLIDIKEVKPEMFSINVNRVTLKELASFCRQLGQLLDTSVSVVHAMELIGEGHKNKHFREVLMDIVRDIKGGANVSRCLEKHPKVFPEMMIYQVKAAEDGGYLGETLKSLSANFERDADFNKKIRGAFMYPGFIILVTIGILWFMLTKIVPQLNNTLSSFDAELPNLTKMVVAVSEAFQSYWLIGIGVVIGVSVLSTFLLKQPTYRLVFDKLVMRIPLIGNLVAVINIARICRVMSSLMSSGVGIDQTLTNVNKVLSNKAIQEAMNEAKDDVINRGQSLYKALEKYPHFPKTFVQIVKIGEETGNLSEVLEQLAGQYEKEVGESLKLVTSAINPILMIGIGGIVGVVVVSMFLPMFSLMNSF